MAKFKAFAATPNVGSRYSVEFEIDDEDLEGLSPEELDDYLYNEAQEVIIQYVDIWCEEL